MQAPIRYLTKSRFKQALECPTKLHYSGRPEYANRSLDNSFLAALAEGGFQVGALACLLYPGGVLITDTDHASALRRTREALRADEVTIYEAALEADGLFVRVDILRKRGDVVELLEVKAKSYDPAEDGDLRSVRGKLTGEYLPYLQDIAFQCHVAAAALPGMRLVPYLVLADKSARASVDGLNQRFKLSRRNGRTQVEVAPGTDAAALGERLLYALEVGQQVDEIRHGTLRIGPDELPFAQAVERLAAAYARGERLGPFIGAQCGPCEYKTAALPAPNSPRSGFHECWQHALGWDEAQFQRASVLELWNCRKKGQLIESGVVLLSQLQPEDLGFDGSEPDIDGMSRKHRQWYQCAPDWPGGGATYLDREGLAADMRQWRWPLHFIDFETSAVAIPFHAGQRPYETVAFQFSHHVMHADGRVEHKTQFLEATPGVDPRLPFVRALRKALAGDDGTVLRWAAHENTVLSQLRRHLLGLAEARGAPPDAAALAAFIETLITYDDGHGRIAGPRNMVDLCRIAERRYFDPATRGSSSLKKVLPALMRSSPRLRELYAQPLYATPAMPSLNFKQPLRWWVEQDGQVLDPYRLLPPVFADLDLPADADDEALDELKEGGAAMQAYGRLQFEQLAPNIRSAIETALLRYCELDTLAMVMCVQGWRVQPWRI